MNTDIAKLLELARTDQPDPFQQLVHTLRTQGENDAAVLLEALESPDETRRRAAVTAAQGRTDPDVLQAVVALAHDPALAVRQNLAYALAPGWPLDAVAAQLLLDHDPGVRQSAVWAAIAPPWRPSWSAASARSQHLGPPRHRQRPRRGQLARRPARRPHPPRRAGPAHRRRARAAVRRPAL